MDDVDVVNEKAEQYIAEALKLARTRSESPPSTGICLSCHESIEADRLRDSMEN